MQLRLKQLTEWLSKHNVQWLWWLSIALLAITSSYTGLNNDFAFDDIHIIKNNVRVHTLQEWWRVFGQGYWRQGDMQTLYRPLTILGFCLEWAAGNGSPWPFHLVNILLYVAVCLVLYWLLRILFKTHKWISWIGAALFAVHPVHVEAVGNVVGQAELTCGLIVLLSIGLYIRWRAEGWLTPRRVAILATLYLAACLFKEHGILLIPLFLATELLLVNSDVSVRQRLVKLRPFFLLLIAIVVGCIWVRSLVLGEVQGDLPHPAWVGMTWGTRFWTMAAAGMEWFRLLFWPASLSVDYSPSRVMIKHGPELEMLATLMLVGGFVAIATLLRKRITVVTFGVVWIAITLSLVSNLVFASGVIIAERTLFLPSAGLMMVVGGLLIVAQERFSMSVIPLRVVAIAFLIVVIVLGSVHSARRQLVWRSNMSVFTTLRNEVPTDYRGHWVYASVLYKAGQVDDAIRVLEAAYQLFDRDAEMTDELGYRYKVLGDCDRAIPLFRKSLTLQPARSITRGRLAMCLIQQGKIHEAWNEALIGMEHPGQPKNAIRLVRAVLDTARTRRFRLLP